MKYAGILYKYNGLYLLCRRQEGVTLGGYWSVPGGAVERGETEPEAAIREFFEETQISLNIFKLILIDQWQAINPRGDGSFYLYKYEGAEKSEPILDYEHTECGYFHNKNIPSPIEHSLRSLIEEGI
jgi:ADP-ribose pyrophosphatase YjhB (NUDIX family)